MHSYLAGMVGGIKVVDGADMHGEAAGGAGAGRQRLRVIDAGAWFRRVVYRRIVLLGGSRAGCGGAAVVSTAAGGKKYEKSQWAPEGGTQAKHGISFG